MKFVLACKLILTVCVVHGSVALRAPACVSEDTEVCSNDMGAFPLNLAFLYSGKIVDRT